MNPDWRILAIVLFKVKPKLWADGMCINCSGNTVSTLAQHQQHRLIYIIVN